MAEEGIPGRGDIHLPKTDIGRNLVELTQYMWQHREIPTDLEWKILVLTPKGNTDTRGIGLLYTLWKVAEAIIDTSLKVCTTFHDILQILLTGRGTGWPY